MPRNVPTRGGGGAGVYIDWCRTRVNFAGASFTRVKDAPAKFTRVTQRTLKWFIHNIQVT